MTAVSTIAAQRAPLRLGATLVSRPAIVAVFVVLIVTALRFGGGVDSDIASQLGTAQRIHEGARLYRDIVEVNPPLWFWMAVPVERLASLLHVTAANVLFAALGLIVMVS